MYNLARSALSLSAILAVLSACADSPTQPDVAGALDTSRAEAVTRDVTEEFYHLADTYVQFECEDGSASELIAMEGFIFARATFIQDAAGGFHFREHWMPVGLKGVGVDTGEHYRVKESQHSSANKAMGQAGMYREAFTIVGKDSGSMFKMVVSGRYIVNANGEIVVEKGHARYECVL
jgi:hypothetical protein